VNTKLVTPDKLNVEERHPAKASATSELNKHGSTAKPLITSQHPLLNKQEYDARDSSENNF